jgi:hypothetical protein
MRSSSPRKEICFFRNRQNEFEEFFSQENDLVFCNDVWCVIEAVRHQHDPTEWRLSTDPSKVVLKALLLHYGKKFPSVPHQMSLTCKSRMI